MPPSSPEIDRTEIYRSICRSGCRSQTIAGRRQTPQPLGFTKEEKALYEILANHRNVIYDFELIKELVRKILVIVKKSATQPDWYKKEIT